MHRILKTISDCELSLYHPIMDDDAMIWKTHLGIVEKRGGNLCAPIPKPLGFSGYLNDMTQDLLAQRMHEYKEIVSRYPRGGRGVEELCVDVGLEDPQSKKMQKRAAAELSKTQVENGKLELLAKLKNEGLLTEEQVQAQKERIA
jgi:3-dehydroquinate synthase